MVDAAVAAAEGWFPVGTHKLPCDAKALPSPYFAKFVHEDNVHVLPKMLAMRYHFEESLL